MSQTIKTILLFIFMNSSSFMLQAQNKPSILLSNYTFSSGRNRVGLITSEGEPVRTLKLTGENAKAFALRKGQLWILPKYIVAGASYDITISDKVGEINISDTFRIVNDQFIQNKVIAHRGAWKNTGAPENSIAALNHAVRLGCSGSEFDVQMSADSVLVINHDPEIQNTSIEKAGAKDLLKLKLANGESLPTLESFLKVGTSQNTTKLILEIKPSTISKARGIATTQRVVHLVRNLRAQAWIDYISFDYDICKEILRLDPYARVAYLNGDKTPEELRKDNMWGYDYHLSVLKKNESWIPKAKNEKLTTNVWTVNDSQTMEWFLNKGIDFITTNEPELLLKLLKNAIP